jgi:glutaredoxin
VEPLEIFGKPDCVDFNRSKLLLDSLDVPFIFHDILADPDAAAEALRVSGGTGSPVIVYPDGGYQVEPSDADLAAKLGYDASVGPNAVDGEVCEI